MSSDRILLIVNPTRSTRARPLLARIKDILERLGVRYDLKFTERRGHGMQLAAHGVGQGYGTIVAVGGDGTVNEVVNGVVGSEAAVFSIPLGAGNDFLRNLGIRTWEEACHALAEGGFSDVDLGLAEYRDDAGRLKRRYYAVLADVGFGTEVLCNLPRRFRHALGGNLGYVISLYRTATQGRAGARRMRLDVDGQLRCEEKLLLVEALIGPYAGGGLKVAPEARVDDGLLDVFVARDINRIGICTLFPMVYRGTHIRHEKTEYFHAREVEIDAEVGMRTSLDGEVVGYTPVKLKVIPGALRIRGAPGRH